MIGKAVFLLRPVAALAVLFTTCLSLSAPAMAQGVPTGADDVEQGIKVHGHWVIEVRNPDGSLVATYEFRNSLTTSGRVTLADMLVRDRVPSNWSIRLEAGTQENHPCGAPFQGLPCHIIESTDPSAGQEGPYFPTLTVERGGTTGDPTVILSGTATAQRDGEVYLVRTTLSSCDGGDTTPSACVGNATRAGLFTEGGFFSPRISVVTGQSILATVTLSFS